MPDPRVSILKRDGLQSAFYTNYADARTASADGDVIIVWGDLNEPINLKNKVDIWLLPGVIVNNTTTDTATKGPTVRDNGNSVECNIYGLGIILNTFFNNSDYYECINISGVNTKLSVECDYIEAIGSTILNSISGSCVNVSRAKKFHLNCKKIYNQNNNGIALGSIAKIEDLNLNIQTIETGIPGSTNTGNTALITRGNGFIRIDEILCRNLGHCFSHRNGEITANIKKLTTKMNRANAIAAVHLDQGTGTQKLIMYFDEILNFNGSFNSGIGIHLHEGTGIFIGRRVYSENEEGVDISGNNTKGYIKINEIISLNKAAIRSFSNNEQIIIDSDYIEGFGITGSVYMQDDANLILKNAKIINTDDTSDSKCIVLEKPDTLLPNLTLNNIKAVTGNTSVGTIIFQAGFTGISIKNYGFFANKNLDTGISLAIGDSSNFFFIVSPDLT